MYSLSPIIHPQVQSVLDRPEKLREWVRAFGSPLNVLFPTNAAENLTKYLEIFSLEMIKGRVYYAYKSNKSLAVLKELALQEVGVDVASEQELMKALSAGFSGNRIEATGPKDDSFLRLAILHNITINLDSLAELQTVVELHQSHGCKEPISVYIRLNGISKDNSSIIQNDGKFGFFYQEIQTALQLISKNKKQISLKGFSFHLTTISETERVSAINYAFELTITAIKLGLQPTDLNIGGGFSLNHLQHASEWNAYISGLKKSLLDSTQPSMSWNQSGLGFWAERGKVRGAANYSEFYRPINQFEELQNLLKAKTANYGTVSQFLQENLLTLVIEPGRSLVDQVGITISKVNGVKQSRNGETVIMLDMNRSHLNAAEYELMSDPILIRDPSNTKHTDGKTGMFLSGNLCLPHDFICKRKVFLDHEPQPNDLLVFINTAGYFMDFGESSPIQHSIAQKIAVRDEGWWLDEKYEPTTMKRKGSK